jgi:hypothetical protein
LNGSVSLNDSDCSTVNVTIDQLRNAFATASITHGNFCGDDNRDCNRSLTIQSPCNDDNQRSKRQLKQLEVDFILNIK